MNINDLKSVVLNRMHSTDNSTERLLMAETDKFISDYKTMNNELCLKCGKYKTSHMGSCDGCRWRM